MSNTLRYIIFSVTLPFIVISGCQAQSFEGKSAAFLTQKLKRTKTDTLRVSLLLALSRNLLFRSGASKSDLDSANLLLQQAELLTYQLHDAKKEGQVLLMSALLLNRDGARDKGLAAAQKALAIFLKIADLPDQAEATILIGQHYATSGNDLDVKISYYQKAVALFLKSGYRARAATTLKDIGDFQLGANRNPEAMKALQSALSIYQTIHFKDLQGVYDLIGYGLSRMGDYTNGLKYGLLAVKTAEAVKDSSSQLCTIFNRVAFTYYLLKQYTNSNIYFQKALQIGYKYHDAEAIQSISFNQISVLVLDNKPAMALSVINKIVKNRDKQPNVFLDAEITYVYLKLYLLLKTPAEASLYFNKLIAYRSKIDPKSEFQEKIMRGCIFYYQQTGQYQKSYSYLRQHSLFCEQNHLAMFSTEDHLWWFRADSALGKYQSAIRHYQSYKAKNDSIFNENKSRQAALLQVQYETDKKDKDILLKAKDIQLLTKKEQLQKNRSEWDRAARNVILAGAAMLILLLLVVYNRYRLKQRSNLLLQSQQAEINNQNQTLISLNSKQRVLLQEKEWLLREIHHRVKNNLQISMSLLNIQSAYVDNADALEAIQDSQRRMQAMSLIHQKLYQSDNIALIDMSVYIPELVRYLQESLNHTHPVKFDLHLQEVKLDIAQAVPVGLILNEAITNAIKYAFPAGQSGNIRISMHENEQRWKMLTIEDDGIGLPKNFNKIPHKSLGMSLMRGLTDQLQGEFNLQSDTGTVITIAFAGVNLMEEELAIS